MNNKGNEKNRIWKILCTSLATILILAGIVGASLYHDYVMEGTLDSEAEESTVTSESDEEVLTTDGVTLNGESAAVSTPSGLANKVVEKPPVPWTLSVTNTTDGLASNSRESKINWWWDKNTGNYYVFLPAVANLSKLRLSIQGAETVTVDGIVYRDSDLFPVETGKYIFTVQGGNVATSQLIAATESNENQTENATQEYQVTILQSGGAGTLLLTTESGSMDYVNADKANRESAKAVIIDAYGQIQYDGPLEYIHGRGNSTWSDGYKLPYTIKLSKKTDLFHMGVAKKWVLLANQWDDSLLRNYAVHDMASSSDVAFTAESTFVDFYTNGDYQGNYQLSEKVEVGTERVNIPDLEKETENVNPGKELAAFPTFGATVGVEDTIPSTMKGYQIEKDPNDITGGYLFTMNIGYSYLKRDAGFVTSRNQAINIEGPSHPSVQQVYYIANLYQEMEDALYAWDGINPNTGKAYYDYMDIDSFAKKYLVEEISMNLDASIASQYMYKYPDTISTKIYAGPIWDYDKSLGNGGTDGYNSTDLTNPEGMYASQDVTPSCIWYAIFFRPEFSQAVVENYYDSFRQNALIIAEQKIDVWSENMLDSVTMNAVRWNIYRTDDTDMIHQGYADEITNLKDFITRRIAYLDTQWVQE